MSRILGVLALLVLVFGLGLNAAAADILTQSECEAAGGVFTREAEGYKTCTYAGDSEPEKVYTHTNNWYLERVETGGFETQKGAIGAPGTAETYESEDGTVVYYCYNNGGELKDGHNTCASMIAAYLASLE